ncbi:rhodanese-like domain-containing protein [Bosea sp. BK604]|uniref:rhodanese-like domain-containing protein n=1 Tax=Bosea sp. BK604 TaxID=2512180 RepID=UPI001049ACAB|nr:rhodanese-like domain-containing protein [Bosea sp. BK604]TCR69801.1 rhodanese-related sulfurtransferase [Bosea sp. BK604]
MRRRTVLAGMIALATGPVRGQSPISSLPPREAHDGAKAGRIVLIDIRSSDEWADTGVPRGAVRLDADGSGFEVRLAGIRLDNPGKRIVLIDRSGGQANAIQQKLAGRGWRDLAIVRGGMLGSGGWLAEKLPVE